MELTLESAWELLKAIWKWLVGAGVLVLLLREWWHERAARRTSMYQKRREVVDGIQSRLVELKRSLQLATSAIQGADDPHGLRALQEAAEAYEIAVTYFESNRHYLPPHVAELVKRFLSEARTAQLYWGLGIQGRGLVGKAAGLYAQKTLDAHNIVRTRLPPLMAEIGEEFILSSRSSG